MVANQTERCRHEQGSVIKLLAVGSANHVKFTEECMVCTEKLVLAKMIFTNGLNMGLLQRV